LWIPPFLLMYENSQPYQRLRTLCTDCDTENNTSENIFKMICESQLLFSYVTLWEDVVTVPQTYSCSLRKKNTDQTAVDHCFGIKCKKNWLFIREN
jgi:hypothetical protein